MRRVIGAVVAVLVSLCNASPTNAQVVSLLVGNNQSGFSGLDRYDSTNGAYAGVFAGAASGSQFSYFKYGGPSNDLFVNQGINVLHFNGHTGAFIGNFITQTGSQFAFGSDNNLYRLEPFSQTQGFPRQIGKYDGATGVRLGTFVAGSASGLDTASGSMRFGPDGNLYVDNGNTILRYNGITGSPMGAFIPPGSGGIIGIFDAVFASNGNLIVSGGNGTTNDSIYRFDGSTGTFLGVFASGNGINVPFGIAEGPDTNIYLASSFSNEIKRFNLTTGAFIDNFVPNNAHLGPTYIGFTPYPVPEPTSIAYCASVCAAIGVFRFWRKAFGGICTRLKSSCFEHYVMLRG